MAMRRIEVEIPHDETEEIVVRVAVFPGCGVGHGEADPQAAPAADAAQVFAQVCPARGGPPAQGLGDPWEGQGEDHHSDEGPPHHGRVARGDQPGQREGQGQGRGPALGPQPHEAQGGEGEQGPGVGLEGGPVAEHVQHAQVVDQQAGQGEGPGTGLLQRPQQAVEQDVGQPKGDQPQHRVPGQGVPLPVPGHERAEPRDGVVVLPQGEGRGGLAAAEAGHVQGETAVPHRVHQLQVVAVGPDDVVVAEGDLAHTGQQPPQQHRWQHQGQPDPGEIPALAGAAHGVPPAGSELSQARMHHQPPGGPPGIGSCRQMSSTRSPCSRARAQRAPPRSSHSSALTQKSLSGLPSSAAGSVQRARAQAQEKQACSCRMLASCSRSIMSR